MPTAASPADLTSSPASPNRAIALASAAAAVVLFLATRFGQGGPDLGTLATAAVPYDEVTLRPLLVLWKAA